MEICTRIVIKYGKCVPVLIVHVHISTYHTHWQRLNLTWQNKSKKHTCFDTTNKL